MLGGQVAVVEERGDATGGEAAELDEGLGDIRARRDAAISVKGVPELRVISSDDGSQQTIAGCRARIELEAAPGAEAVGTGSAAAAAPQVQIVGANTAAIFTQVSVPGI